MSESKVFVQTVEISTDEAIHKVVELQAKRSILNKEIDNLKAVIKADMVREGEKEHVTDRGSKAKFSESQVPTWDKEAIQVLTGDDFGLCVSYSTVKRFKVT